jgi:hypothetical protein
MYRSHHERGDPASPLRRSLTVRRPGSTVTDVFDVDERIVAFVVERPCPATPA